LAAERIAAGESSDDGNSSDSAEDSGGSGDEEYMMDMEDIGAAIAKSRKKIKKSKPKHGGPPKKMINKKHEESLTKEGYKLIGSHSAVKLCRWTKSMLRGRGGCYKHTFYGIQSHQCMEATPSLACANKCVFCWRHHKNPVGREWRWQTDQPDFLIDGALTKHAQMIKQLRGMPGLKEERFQEAQKVRHCALSLVGEPIIYPKINDFLRRLHENKISTFMVTNAQFPDKMNTLEPVTQLYVSIDGSTKESLQEVDRPLFKAHFYIEMNIHIYDMESQDFWERFLACLDELREKGQRTVYRLTLVKSYNMQVSLKLCLVFIPFTTS